MGFRRKRLKVYSITGVLSLVLLFTFLNISWKTDPHQPIVSADSTVMKMNANEESGDSKEIVFTNYMNDLYQDAGLKEADLSLPVFEKALVGFFNLKSNHQLNRDKEILTVVDFTKSSSTKRMWIIDLKNRALLLNTYVAHGQGSGEDLATAFSNTAESHQSSLGFYVTNETYLGKHGLSLRLDGQDRGSNDLARNRAIVVHGAPYVSEHFIKQTGRLGRSFGCPAIPVELTNQVISIIKDKTCLFINGNSDNYQSKLLNQHIAMNGFSEFPHS